MNNASYVVKVRRPLESLGSQIKCFPFKICTNYKIFVSIFWDVEKLDEDRVEGLMIIFVYPISF